MAKRNAGHDVQQISKGSEFKLNTTVLEDFSRALITGLRSDLTLVVGPNRRKFSVHTTILSFRSPVFHQWLKNLQQNSVEVKLPHFSSTVFAMLLRYIYTNSMRDVMEYEHAIQLWELAEHYKLEDLVKRIVRVLIDQCADDNVVEIYQKAVGYKRHIIKRMAFQFLLKDLSGFLKGKEFLKLTLENVCELFDSEELDCSELELFQAAIRWGNKYCDENIGIHRPTRKSEDLREVLDSVIPLIRFPLMSAAEIATIVTPTQILNTKELLLLFNYIFAPEDKKPSFLMFNMNPRKLSSKKNLEVLKCSNKRKLTSSKDATVSKIENICSPPNETFVVGPKNVAPILPDETVFKMPMIPRTFAKQRVKSLATRSIAKPPKTITNVLVQEKNVNGQLKENDVNVKERNATVQVEDRNTTVQVEDRNTTVQVEDRNATVQVEDRNTTVQVEDRNTTVQVEDRNTTVQVEDRNTTVQVEDRNTTVQVEDRNTTVQVDEKNGNIANLQVKKRNVHLRRGVKPKRGLKSRRIRNENTTFFREGTVPYWDRFVDRYIKKEPQITRESTTSFVLKNFKIEKMYRKIPMPDMEDLTMDLKISLPDGFPRFAENFDLRKFVFFSKNRNLNKSWKPQNLWNMDVVISIKVNGVTMLKVDPNNMELTISFQHRSDAIMAGLRNSVPLRKLNLMYTYVPNFDWFPTRWLQKVMLYHVVEKSTTEKTVRVSDFVRKCPNLEELSCWTSLTRGEMFPTIDLTKDFVSSDKLTRLALSRFIVNFTPKTVKPNVTQLFLDVCFWPHNFDSNIHLLFPSLTRVSIRMADHKLPEEIRATFTPAVTARLVNNLIKLKNIQFIRIWGVNWKERNSSDVNLKPRLRSRSLPISNDEIEKVQGFLSEYGLRSNFILEKNVTTGEWKGTELNEKEPKEVDTGFWDLMDQLEYQDFQLQNFFRNYQDYQNNFNVLDR